MPNVIFKKKSHVQNKAAPLQLLSYLLCVSQKFFSALMYLMGIQIQLVSFDCPIHFLPSFTSYDHLILSASCL